MTVITVFRKGGRLVGFDAVGHADYADAGEDIVCAAISAVTQTAVLGITELIGCSAAFEMEDGCLRLMLDGSVEDEQWQRAELILGTMLVGLRSIQDEYCDYLKLIEREV
ncbi:MAG: ribosomal-processing cysteine protease Prp [Christensenellaceae bacterium]|nr:ribosomal-processing cysteine protease Prp [Christensenellaceae bacterium]